MASRARQNRRRQLFLATAPAPLARAGEIYLLQTSTRQGVEKLDVDREAGIIRGVAVLTAGMACPAVGDPFAIDEVMLNQVADAINATSAGVRSRVTHPELEATDGGHADGIWCLVGRVKNARIVRSPEGLAQVRADVHLGAYARSSPEGDLWTWLLDIAASDPSIIAMSIRAASAPFAAAADGTPVGRIGGLVAVDFVEFGGGNPGGLLAGQPMISHATKTDRGDGSPGITLDAVPAPGTQSKETPMQLNARQLAYLMSIGMKANVSEADAKAFIDALTMIQQQFLDSLADPGQPAVTTPPADGADATNVAGRPAPAPAPGTINQAGSNGGNVSLAGSGAGQGQQTITLSAEQHEAVLKGDRDRRAAIIALAKERNLPVAWAQGLGDRGVTLAAASDLADLAGTMNLVRSPHGSIEVGADRNLATLAPALADCMCLAAGVPLIEQQGNQPARNADGSIRLRQPAERAATIGPLNVVMLAKRFLREIACPGLEDMSEGRILELALSRRKLADYTGNSMFLAMGTSDFVHALDTSIRNAIRAKYWTEVVAATWQKWCQRTTNPDYRATGYVLLSEIPDLLLKAEGENFRHAVIKDSKQTIIVNEFGRIYQFTAQSLKNGMQALLVDFPAGLVNAARRKENLLPVAALIANPTMADNERLFSAAHGNYVATTGGAVPSFATLNAMILAMATQTGMLDEADSDGSPMALEIEPYGLLVPKQLEFSSRQLITSPVDPTLANATPNPLAGLLPGGVIGLGQLSAASTTRWYGFAQPGRIGGGMVLAFLDGEEAPVVESEKDFDSDDYKVKIKHNLGCGPSDYRGLYANEGKTL